MAVVKSEILFAEKVVKDLAKRLKLNRFPHHLKDSVPVFVESSLSVDQQSSVQSL